MLSKAQKWVSISIGVPLLRNMDGCFFLGGLFIIGIFIRSFRDMQNAL